MGRLIKMFERELAARGIAEVSPPEPPPLGGLDRTVPPGDRDNPIDEEPSMIQRVDTNPAGMPITVTCDHCGTAFECKVHPYPDLDPATAAALCDRCGDLMVRLQERRRKDPFAYNRFKVRVAESVARKLGIVPKGN